MTVGSVIMKSRYHEESSIIATVAKVDSTDYMKKIYYIHGDFGTKWNYKFKRPIAAYEKIYQGKIFKKRSYTFSANKVTVDRTRMTYHEYSYPHNLKTRKVYKKKTTTATGFQDLLGAFHYIRSLPKKPKVGEVVRIKVLPGGRKKMLVMKVLAMKKVETSHFGTKKVFYVQTGLSSLKRGKKSSDANIFFKTKSKIYSWISDDKNFLPLKIWTKLPYLGKVEIELVKYEQP